MRVFKSALILILFVANATLWAYTEPQIERTVPSADGVPAVFTEGQEVTVSVPADLTPKPVNWRVLDDRGITIQLGEFEGSPETLPLGRLGIGWYCVEFLTDDGTRAGWTSAAVLAKLSVPTPQDSPVCVDSATAWFAKNDPNAQEAFARLGALTGINWIRDRIHWREMEPEPGRFETNTGYDTSADAQVKHGLKVLQVFHSTPAWAVEEGGWRGRYPTDLRHAYRFCKAMAEHFKGRVHAWEPWNEGNVPNFGGHTADEMCSYQKAAYLGFKAGDPDVIVGWNVSTAKPTELHTRVVLANETWSYFDTYNTHTYDWPDSYERLWGPTIEAASGRPIWITEADRGLPFDTPAPWADFTLEKAIDKAQFMAQSYATSLFAGADRHFHFVLGHYCENGKIQFGLLRLDRTPRPSYVALAALGRFLAGAKCLGKWDIPDQPHAHVYAFAAEPDGKERDVLVAWAEKPGDWSKRGKTVVDWSLPENATVTGVYDYLGRDLRSKVPAQLTSSPVFVLLESGKASALPLRSRPTGTYREGKTCPIVMQLALPRSHSVDVKQIPWACDHEHQVEPDKEMDLPLYVYNFGNKTLSGEIHIAHAPTNWKLQPRQWEMTLEPMARIKLPCRFSMPKCEMDKKSDNWIKLQGDFNTAADPVLAFRLISEPGEGYEADLP